MRQDGPCPVHGTKRPLNFTTACRNPLITKGNWGTFWTATCTHEGHLGLLRARERFRFGAIGGTNEEVLACTLDFCSYVSSCRQLENIAGPAKLSRDPEGASDRAVCAGNAGELRRLIGSAGMPGQRYFATWRHDPVGVAFG